jgi:archaellum component FlaG (FlaF/FlaG flagellin family)
MFILRPKSNDTMKSFLIVFVAIIIFSISVNGQIKYWEDLSCSQKTDILEACKSESVKKLYEGNFVLSDDKKAEKLLNELIVSDVTILPSSFYLFNKISIESDGALSEMAGEYHVDFLARHPGYILTYFTIERNRSVNNPVWKNYAEFIGYELYFKNRGTSDLNYNYQSFKEILVSASKGDKENEETFRIFWQLVDETIKNMD